MFLAPFTCPADEVQCGDGLECVEKGDQQRSFKCVFLSILSMLPAYVCDFAPDCENEWDEPEHQCCDDPGEVKCGDTEECVSYGNQKFV